MAHVGVIQTWAQGPGLRHGTVIVLPRSVGVTFVLVRLPWLARVMTSAVSRFYIIPILYSDAVTLSLYHISSGGLTLKMLPGMWPPF